MAKGKKVREETPAPITEGSRIEGTSLFRRFQNGQELYPVFKGTQAANEINVLSEADKAGYRGVYWESAECTYVKINGEWYHWYLYEWHVSPVETQGEVG